MEHVIMVILAHLIIGITACIPGIPSAMPGVSTNNTPALHRSVAVAVEAVTSVG
jgi:hypothetical protein